MKPSDRIGGLALFLFGAITALRSLNLPIGTFREPGSGLFPLCLGLLLMFLAGIFLASLWRQREGSSPQQEPRHATTVAKMQLLLFLGAMGLAVLLYNPLGYPIDSFLLMLALLRILGVKRWGLNMLISLSTAMATYFLFVRWLDIPLPKGWIGL